MTCHTKPPHCCGNRFPAEVTRSRASEVSPWDRKPTPPMTAACHAVACRKWPSSQPGQRSIRHQNDANSSMDRPASMAQERYRALPNIDGASMTTSPSPAMRHWGYTRLPILVPRGVTAMNGIPGSARQGSFTSCGPNVIVDTASEALSDSHAGVGVGDAPRHRAAIAVPWRRFQYERRTQ